MKWKKTVLNLITDIFCSYTRDATGKGSVKPRAKTCNKVKNKSQDRKKMNRMAAPSSDHLHQPSKTSAIFVLIFAC